MIKRKIVTSTLLICMALSLTAFAYVCNFTAKANSPIVITSDTDMDLSTANIQEKIGFSGGGYKAVIFDDTNDRLYFSYSPTWAYYSFGFDSYDVSVIDEIKFKIRAVTEEINILFYTQNNLKMGSPKERIGLPQNTTTEISINAATYANEDGTISDFVVAFGSGEAVKPTGYGEVVITEITYTLKHTDPIEVLEDTVIDLSTAVFREKVGFTGGGYYDGGSYDSINNVLTFSYPDAWRYFAFEFTKYKMDNVSEIHLTAVSNSRDVTIMFYSQNNLVLSSPKQRIDLVMDNPTEIVLKASDYVNADGTFDNMVIAFSNDGTSKPSAWGNATISEIKLVLISNDNINRFEANDSNLSVTASVNSTTSKLDISITDEEERSYQVWLKTKMQLHTIDSNTKDSVVWMMVASFGDTLVNDTLSLDDFTQNKINGYYYLLLRAKNMETGEITQKYKQIAISETENPVTDIKINGQEVSEYNYYITGEQVTISAICAEAFEVIDIDGSVQTSASGSVTYTVKQGRNAITVKSANGTETTSLVIYGYDVFENYTKITEMKVSDGSNFIEFGEKIINTSDTIYLQINTETVGTGSTVQAKLYIANKTIYLANLNALNTFSFDNNGLGYGVYPFTVKLINTSTGLTEDYFTGYLNYSRTSILPSIEVEYSATSNANEYTITAFNPQNMGDSLQYQFIKWDALGEYVVRDWGTNSLTVTIRQAGVYRFEIRAKGTGAGSYETRKIITIGKNSEGTQTISVLTTDETSVTIGAANTPYIVTVAEDEYAYQYKFIVRSYGQWKVAEYYSPSNSFVWVPQKSGEYTIEVRINTNSNYGYADIIAYKTIMVLQ